VACSTASTNSPPMKSLSCIHPPPNLKDSLRRPAARTGAAGR
jgi:hypothetical protein